MVYNVTIGTGIATTYSDTAEAFNEQEALDIVADRLVEDGAGFVLSQFDVERLCDDGQTVSEYVDSNNLCCCGNTGVFVDLIDIEKVSE